MHEEENMIKFLYKKFSLKLVKNKIFFSMYIYTKNLNKLPKEIIILVVGSVSVKFTIC